MAAALAAAGSRLGAGPPPSLTVALLPQPSATAAGRGASGRRAAAAAAAAAAPAAAPAVAAAPGTGHRRAAASGCCRGHGASVLAATAGLPGFAASRAARRRLQALARRQGGLSAWRGHCGRRGVATRRLAAVGSEVPAAPDDDALVAEIPEGAKFRSTEEAKADVAAAAASGEYTALDEGTREGVSNFFFPDAEQLDMDTPMPLEDHVREFREGLLRAGIAVVVCVSICLYYYKELVTFLEAPARTGDIMVKFVQLGPGEFFFVSLKAAVAVGFLLAFPYILFEAAVYFTPALTKDERQTLGPTVLASSALFYTGVTFAQFVLAPASLGFFISYGADVIENQFSIDQYFEFILSMGFATGLAFQVPVLQVTLGFLNLVNSQQLLGVWKYVIVGSAIIGAILTPSTDPVTQLLLSGALCGLYFAGAGTLYALGR